MKPETTSDNLAVLIDGDNISSKHVAGLMAEVANYGTASVRRIYGDWTSSGMKSWRECLLEYSINPIQQFAYTVGKNATDGAMIIDAMDLMYTGRFSGFCLVSSDSDFTRLASRLREQGISVYGFGNRHNTHKAFIAACSEFVYFDALSTRTEVPTQSAESLSPRTPIHAYSVQVAGLDTEDTPVAHKEEAQDVRPIAHGVVSAISGSANAPNPHLGRPVVPRKLDHVALQAIRQAIEKGSDYGDGYVNLAEVGIHLIKISPDLNARNYNYPRLKDFVKASGIVEVKMESREANPPIALVRLKR